MHPYMESTVNEHSTEGKGLYVDPENDDRI